MDDEDDPLDALCAEPPEPSDVDVSDLVAEPGVRPEAHQSEAPLDLWSSRKGPVLPSAELTRIVGLPTREPDDLGSVRSLARVRLVTPRFRRVDEPPCRCRELLPNVPDPCILTLREVQAWALYEMPLSKGGLGLIGVGHGKTMLDLLMPLAMKAKRAVLLVPANLLKQLIDNYQLLSQHWTLPQLIVHGRGETDREFRPPVETVVHALSYTRLSRPESTSWLTEVAPDLIIADECDKLANLDTATTSRFIEYVRRSGAMFCGWSGSITGKSITEYSHLAMVGLGEGSPLPRPVDEDVKAIVLDWARAIDPSDSPAPPGALLELCEPGEHIYDGFHRRLVTTRGIIHTTQSSHDTPIEFSVRTPNEVPDVILGHLDILRELMKRPDGWTYDNGFEAAACARQLACGFYYMWEYPRSEPQWLIDEWLDARAAWCSELRAVLRDGREEHFDSEKLVRLAAMRFHGDLPRVDGLPVWESMYWPAWRDIADKVQPVSVPQWIHDFLAEDAAEWANTSTGIVWYDSTAFGKRVANIGKLAWHGGGPDAERLIQAERGDRSIVASIKSHGRGRDGLQHIFCDQLVAQPPSDPRMWEQLLGRLARPGQRAPVVHARYYQHTDELQRYVDKAVMRAAYVQGTLGVSQRILQGMRE